MDTVFELDDLTLGYAGQPTLLHVSGCFERGSLTAIVGPDGPGKSTLLRALVGQLQPMTGRVRMACGRATTI